MKTIIEPFRIKMIEAMVLTDREYRIKQLEAAHYNIFLLNAQDVTIDLLSDSGTGAMSAQQWAGMMLGDETTRAARHGNIFNVLCVKLGV